MPRVTRAVAAGLAVVVLAGLLVLVFGPARGARADIATQKKLITAQLATMRSQLALQRQQLQLGQQQLEVAKQTRDIAVQTRDIAARSQAIAAQTLAVARGTKADVDLQLVISRALQALAEQLTSIARETLRHAANIDRKTGPTPAR